MFRRFDRPKRAGKGSSSEECYASPVLASTGINTLSPPPAYRFRRYRGSSTDEAQDEGEYINEDYRVGGPELVALPCEMQPFPQQHPAYEMWERDSTFGDMIKGVIQQYGIDARSITPICRVSSNPCSSRQVFPTLLISAKRHAIQDASWLDACKKLRQYFAYRQLPSLNVEILDPRAEIKKLPSVVPIDDPIYPIWEQEVIPKIRPILGRQGWVALECFRWGAYEDRAKNPTTVVLTVPYDTDHDWRPVREGIVNVLNGFRLDHVAVAILRGHIWRGADTGLAALPNNAWETHVQCGLSIGPLNSTVSASTFGAVVELLNPVSNQWLPFGITCFSSVMPVGEAKSEEEKNLRARWEKEGIWPSDDAAALKYLRLDQPALKDHQYRLGLLGQAIKEVDRMSIIVQYQQDEANGELTAPPVERRCKGLLKNQLENIELRDTAKKFFETGQAGLGYVFAASGFRTMPESDTGGQLDWALLHINKARLAPNKIPPVGRHDGRCTFSGDPILHPAQEDPKAGAVMFKLGRTTNATEGQFNGLKSLVLKTGKDEAGNNISKTNLEHCIVSFNSKYPFSQEGDSGAVILDKEGYFVDLLFAGGMESNVTYFTPWKRLFDDIRAMTGVRGVRFYSEKSERLDGR